MLVRKSVPVLRDDFKVELKMVDERTITIEADAPIKLYIKMKDIIQKLQELGYDIITSEFVE